MKRAQKQMHAISERANMPKGSWVFGLNHVCAVHNVTPKLSRMSPQEEATGIKPTWKPDKVYGQKCYARLYNKGKLETKAVECVYLGFDNFCRADVVRPYNSRLASNMERYASVTTHVPDHFPYAFPTVPRPPDYGSQDYDSDTEDEDNGQPETPLVSVPLHVQRTSLLAKDPLRQVPPNKRKSTVPPEPSLPDTVLAVKNRPPRKMSEAALRQFQSFLSVHVDEDDSEQISDMVEHRKYRFCFLSHTYVSSDSLDQDSTDPDNPFRHLFNPATETMWEDPKTLAEVYKHQHRDYYLAAMHKERNAWLRNKVYTIIPKSEIPIDPRTGKQFKPMRTQPIWSTKVNRDLTVNKFKYRLCLDGSRQNKSRILTYEPMVSVASLRVFFDLVVRFNLIYRKADAQEFFLNFKVRDGEQYYMNLPAGWHPEYDSATYAAALNRAAYGIPSATQTAGEAMHNHLTLIMGFLATIHDPRVYIKWYSDIDLALIMTHVDDSLYGATRECYLDEIIKGLNALCPTLECKNPDTFRGIEITDSDDLKATDPRKPSGNGRWIQLSQMEYAKALPKKFGYDKERVPNTPCPPLNTAEDHIPQITAKRQQIRRYMEIQGCLQWLMLTIPSCNFTVNWLSRWMQNPQPRHIAIQKQCLLYMAHIADKGCYFHRTHPPLMIRKGATIDDLQGAADATWVDRQEWPNAYSTSGYVYKTQFGTIMHGTKRQNNVTTSSCESEVMANKTCCQQGIWLRGLYLDLGFNFSKPTTIWQDNKSAIATCVGVGHHKNSRHFRVACHFLKELVDRRIFTFNWLSSTEMYADVMTKSLPAHTHGYHERTIINQPAYLRDVIE